MSGSEDLHGTTSPKGVMGGQLIYLLLFGNSFVASALALSLDHASSLPILLLIIGFVFVLW